MSEPALVLDDVTPLDLRKLADRLLEATRVEYVDDGVLLIMNPPAFAHRAIVRLIARAIDRAYVRGDTPEEWTIDSENFQWDLPDQSGRFYVPDIAVSHPGAATLAQERAAIALIVEVTSPASAEHRLQRPGGQAAAICEGGHPAVPSRRSREDRLDAARAGRQARLRRAGSGQVRGERAVARAVRLFHPEH